MLSALKGNTAAAHGASGGGLYNTGTVTISDTTIIGNKALGSSGNCVFRQCGGSAFGGGIYSEAGSLTVFDSTVTRNKVVGIVTCPSGFRCVSSAWGGGFGINNATAMMMTNSTVTGNSVSGGDCQSCVANGGGIFAYGNVSVNNSTVSTTAL